MTAGVSLLRTSWQNASPPVMIAKAQAFVRVLEQTDESCGQPAHPVASSVFAWADIAQPQAGNGLDEVVARELLAILDMMASKLHLEALCGFRGEAQSLAQEDAVRYGLHRRANTRLR